MSTKANTDIIPQLNIVTVEGQNEPLVVDTELAERLGYAEPRAIRKLIKRLAKNQNFGQIHSRDTVSRQLTNGGEREYTVQEYLLTERQALKLVVKSGTPRAEELTEMILDVFEAWRAGRLVTPSQAAVIQQSQINELVQSTIKEVIPMFLAIVRPAIEALSIQVAEVKADVEKVGARASSSIVSKEDAVDIKQKVKQLAMFWLQIGKKPTATACLSAAKMLAYSSVGWWGAGKRHDLLPRESVPRVKQLLDAELKSAREIALTQLKRQQLELRGI